MRVLLFILALLAARAAFFCERQNKSERRSLASHKPPLLPPHRRPAVHPPHRHRRRPSRNMTLPVSSSAFVCGEPRAASREPRAASREPRAASREPHPACPTKPIDTAADSAARSTATGRFTARARA